jgi:hypothetical protein
MKQDKVLKTVVFWITAGCSPVGGNTVASEYTATMFGTVKKRIFIVETT